MPWWGWFLIVVAVVVIVPLKIKVWKIMLEKMSKKEPKDD